MQEYAARQAQLIQNIRQQVEVGAFSATTVPVSHDFDLVSGLCLTAVAFSPAKWAELFAQPTIAKLRALDAGQYYYSNAQLHITIKSVRIWRDPPQFGEEEIIIAKQIFERVVPEFSAIDFQLRGLLRLPTSIAVIGYCDAELGRLIGRLDSALREAGVPDDKQYVSNQVFFGSMTLCRFFQPPSQAFLDWVQRMADADFGSLRVSSIDLISCNAACQQRTLLGRYRLQQG